MLAFVMHTGSVSNKEENLIQDLCLQLLMRYDDGTNVIINSLVCEEIV